MSAARVRAVTQEMVVCGRTKLNGNLAVCRQAGIYALRT